MVREIGWDRVTLPSGIICFRVVGPIMFVFLRILRTYVSVCCDVDPTRPERVPLSCGRACGGDGGFREAVLVEGIIGRCSREKEAFRGKQKKRSREVRRERVKQNETCR